MHIDGRLALWNTLHDGFITQIGGAPGQLNLRVEIQYLTELLPGAPAWIDIQLENVTLFEWCEFGLNGVIEPAVDVMQLELIASKEPEILSAANEGDVVAVCCVEGFLNMRYASFSMKTDGGDHLDYETLLKVAETYWSNFGTKSKLP